MASSVETSRKRALAFIAANNADGAYDDVLHGLAAGRIDIGLLEYDGASLQVIQDDIDRIDDLLAGPKDVLLDYRVESLCAHRDKMAEMLIVARHFAANPILYTMKVA